MEAGCTTPDSIPTCKGYEVYHTTDQFLSWYKRQQKERGLNPFNWIGINIACAGNLDSNFWLANKMPQETERGLLVAIDPQTIQMEQQPNYMSIPSTPWSDDIHPNIKPLIINSEICRPLTQTLENKADEVLLCAPDLQMDRDFRFYLTRLSLSLVKLNSGKMTLIIDPPDLEGFQQKGTDPAGLVWILAEIVNIRSKEDGFRYRFRVNGKDHHHGLIFNSDITPLSIPEYESKGYPRTKYIEVIDTIQLQPPTDVLVIEISKHTN